MTRLPAAAPLVLALRHLLPQKAAGPPSGEVILEPLPSSRPVLRFIFPEGQARAVGKFFTACPPESSLDRSLLKEYDNYFQAAALGLGDGLGLIPRVLVHGDATPTNFLFDDGRVAALDLERLRLADRLWDLSWVAGELKHAWGWRTGNLDGGEAAISRFFSAYLTALPADAALAPRLYFLNPFYMALAELRIARNAYLSWDYRLALIAEARRCLAAGRRL